MTGIGDRVDGFELVDLLGAGGMGRVFRARHPDHPGEIALKLIKDRLSPVLLARFRREVRFLCNLDHPRIVRYVAASLEGPEPYLATSLVRGRSLAAHLDEHRASHPEGTGHPRMRTWALGILEGLAHAHEKGILHRDLKPLNVMIDEAGDPVLIDFGLGRGEELDTVALTREGQPLGTVRYMSPEQSLGLPANARSDLYQWGLIVHELATGKLPFEELGLAAALARRREAAPSPLLDRDSDRDLLDRMIRCLQPDPARRPESARTILESMVENRHEDPGGAVAETPRVIGEYQITGGLGQGGMGQVLEGRDPRSGARVAVKIMHAHLARNPHLLRRFDVEVAAMTRVFSRRVVRVLDHGRLGDLPYLVMEFVAGETLHAKLEAGWQPSLDEILHVLVQIAEGVDELHRRGIIHRDLKPANVMIDKVGDVRILDLGLVFDTQETTRVTEAGRPVGTLMYMAPEMFRDEPTTTAVDVYQIGLILYEMVVGRRGVRSSDAPDVIRARLHRFPPMREAGGHALVEDLGALHDKATAPDPAARFPDARTLLGSLQVIRRALDSRSPAGGPVAAPPGSGLARLHRGILSAATYLLCFVAIVAALLVMRILPDLWLRASRGGM